MLDSFQSILMPRYLPNLTLVTHIVALMSDVFSIIDCSRYKRGRSVFIREPCLGVNDYMLSAIIFNSLLSIIFLLLVRRQLLVELILILETARFVRGAMIMRQKLRLALSWLA